MEIAGPGGGGEYIVGFDGPAGTGRKGRQRIRGQLFQMKGHWLGDGALVHRQRHLPIVRSEQLRQIGLHRDAVDGRRRGSGVRPGLRQQPGGPAGGGQRRRRQKQGQPQPADLSAGPGGSAREGGGRARPLRHLAEAPGQNWASAQRQTRQTATSASSLIDIM